MFDMLTREELHELHGTLCSQFNRQHRIIMGLMDLNQAGGGNIAHLLASPAFKVLDASHREIDEMATEVYAELRDRDAEHASLRELTRDA